MRCAKARNRLVTTYFISLILKTTTILVQPSLLAVFSPISRFLKVRTIVCKIVFCEYYQSSKMIIARLRTKKYMNSIGEIARFPSTARGTPIEGKESIKDKA